MTFKKFEFWLVTIIALVFSGAFIWSVLGGGPHHAGENIRPGSVYDAATLGGRIALVLFVYLAFLIQNYLVFGRLHRKKKYDLLVAASLLNLLLLISSFYYLDVQVPGLFKRLDYIPITAVFFGVFFTYSILKKLIAHYGNGEEKSRLKRKIINEVVVSIIIWFLVFIVLANTNGGMFHTLFPFWVFWVPCSFFLIMLNVYLVIPHYEKEKKSISTLVVYTSILTLLLSFVFGVPFANGSFWGFTFFTATQLFITAPLAWLIYQSNKEKIQQLLFLKKELGRTAADLQFLRSQINPHFLFNALNTLYGTALQENSELTAVGIQKLGDMMRFMLHENVQEAILLEKEVEYLLNYISLQQLRTQHAEDIKIDVKLSDEHLQYKIAPMLLIPFVENAFKHGISLKEKSWIKISLSCKNDMLYFDVYNSIHSKIEADPEKNESGIGLANVRQRLEMIYPHRHELIVRETASEFIVHLSVTVEPLEFADTKHSAENAEETVLEFGEPIQE